jgi:hypothetical protein
MKKHIVALMLLVVFILVDVYLIINFYENKWKLIASVVSLILFSILLFLFLKRKTII